MTLKHQECKWVTYFVFTPAKDKPDTIVFTSDSLPVDVCQARTRTTSTLCYIERSVLVVSSHGFI